MSTGRDPRVRRLLAAYSIDSLGSGLWFPFALIFFTRAQGQTLQSAGLAMTVGSVLALAVGLLSGGIIDRIGPLRLIVGGNVVRACVFATYPFVDSFWHMAVGTFLIFAADRVFWSANVPLLSAFLNGRTVDKLLGTATMLQTAGLGIGAAAASLLAGSVTGLHWIAWANAISFALAAVVVVGLKVGRTGVEIPEAEVLRGHVWRDRPFLQLSLTQVLLTLAGSSFVIILPLVALDVFRGPQWLPSAAIVLGNVAIVALQRPVIAFASRWSRGSALLIAVPFYVVAFIVLATGGPGWATAAVVVLVLGASLLGAVAEVLANTLMTAAANSAAPAHLRGRYSALFQTAWGSADAIAPVVFTALLTIGNQALWIVLALTTLAAVPLLIRLRRRLPPAALLTAGE